MERDQAIRLMQDLLRRMVEKKGSDLFITAGFPPAIKIDGEIRPQSDRSLSPEQSAGLVRSIMNDRQTKEFDATKECNFAISPPGIGRFRVSAFVQQGLLQDFLLPRLLRLTHGPGMAALAAAGMFSLAHLPNPILTVCTFVWGLAACLFFLRYRNLYSLSIAHAILRAAPLTVVTATCRRL